MYVSRNDMEIIQNPPTRRNQSFLQGLMEIGGNYTMPAEYRSEPPTEEGFFFLSNQTWPVRLANFGTDLFVFTKDGGVHKLTEKQFSCVKWFGPVQLPATEKASSAPES